MKGMSEPRSFSINYTDGKRKTTEKALLARIKPSGEVEALVVGLDVQDYLTILAALEGAAEGVVAAAQ